MASLDTYATDQGLDPITEALRAAGIPHTVEQTGGNCMGVKVPLDEGATSHVFLVNASFVMGEDDCSPDAAAASRYWDCLGDGRCGGQCEGMDLELYTWGRGDEGASIIEPRDLPGALRENMDGAPCPCGGVREAD